MIEQIETVTALLRERLDYWLPGGKCLRSEMLPRLAAEIVAAGEPNPSLLTSGEVAGRLGVSPQTVRMYFRRGVLPGVRLPSGHTRFRSEDVDEIARAGEVA